METKQMCSKFEPISKFSSWLSAQLEARNMTVSKLSKLSGVHQNTIYNYLAERCEPTLFNVQCIVRALGYDLGAMHR